MNDEEIKDIGFLIGFYLDNSSFINDYVIGIYEDEIKKMSDDEYYSPGESFKNILISTLVYNLFIDVNAKTKKLKNY